MFVFRLTAEEIISILEADDNIVEAKMFIGPPDDPFLSDGDSGDEDGDETNVNHLSGNQLRGIAEAQITKFSDNGLFTYVVSEDNTGEGSDLSYSPSRDSAYANISSNTVLDGANVMETEVLPQI